MDILRRLVRVYGNVFALAKRLNVAHTTVGSWKKKLEDGKALRLNVEARLRELNPREDWSRNLLFGFDDAMYSLPALLAIHRIGVLGHLNIGVKSFPSSGPMSQELQKGGIHLAVISKTLWNLMTTDETRAASVSALVDIGAAPVCGKAGKLIETQADFSGMIVYTPAGTAIGARVREFFDTFDARLRDVRSLAPASAKADLSKANLTATALIGSPLWVEQCIIGQTSHKFHEINPSLMPLTPAILAYNRACPHAPLRIFLTQLDEVLANLSNFLDSSEWDLGSEVANATLKKMVDFAIEQRGAGSIAKFRRDAITAAHN
jgi:hypothetical protein